MAYTSGDTILATHYNSFVSDFNTNWGTGSGDQGYGQSNTLSTVSAGDTVTATQWSTLLARETTAATHQGKRRRYNFCIYSISCKYSID